MEQKHNAAKFAFFYLLSLVALVFVSTSVGSIVFQLINKYIPDILDNYSGSFTSGAVRYGIAGLIITAPVFYYLTHLINKSLYQGKLEKDSVVRRWLTYFVLLVTSIVVIGWLIGIVINFLDGGLTLKFSLQALTAIIIAGIVFSYYLYDARRKEVINKKDNIIRAFFYITILIVIASFVGALFVVESPKKARQRRIDQEIVNNFVTIDGEINRYYAEFKKLPENLDVLKDEYNYLQDEDMVNPMTSKKYEYKIASDLKYELCTDFYSSTKSQEDRSFYYDQRWVHEDGYKCLEQKVISNSDNHKDLLVD